MGIYHPNLGFIAKHPDYTLYQSVYAANSPIPTGPLKILLFTIQQTSQRQIHLDIDIETQQIRSALIPFINTGMVIFYAPIAGDFDTLAKLLSKQIWHLVIISGHGLLKNEQTYLVFYDKVGKIKLVTGKDLAKIVNRVRCVVLATCKSGQLVKNNLIDPLIKIGIPNIIGMREALTDRAAKIFIQALCINLAQQKPVNLAVQAGCCAMTNLLSTNETWDAIDDDIVEQWSLPILFSSEPILINWNFTPQKTNLIPKTGIFIGRKQELQFLIKKLQNGKIRRLLIKGIGGIGKTALAEQLAINLLQDGYQVLTSNVKKLASKQIIILTSRYISFPNFYIYNLQRPNFYDFSRYIHYLGLPYEFPQILRIYQILGGNFKAVKLLQNLPICLDVEGLNKQLTIVQRYLQAECRSW
ncbi:MAG TPA: CHAT domain-containing protein [Thioploca sp.]|nr:CHAT domain-containing protein [Thioploca sp.]